jgi:capsular polysaccharide biosynthesis protein
MSLSYFWQRLKSKKLVIGIFVLAFFVVGVGLTLAQPLKYSSSLRLLVVQDSSSAAGDPYAVARSNEYLSDVLSKVVYSTSFYSRAITAGFNIDKAYFGNTNKKAAKNWNKTIEVKKINNTGIISVTAYHPNQGQAERIARAVGYVLITQNQNYHGLGDKVSLKLLDEPINSAWPVKPNLLLNAILSLFLGLVFGLVYIYLLGEKQEEAGPAVDSQSEDWLKELNKIKTADDYRPVDEAPFISRAASTESYGEPKQDDWLNDWR